jgi:glycerate dehydrogenase
MVITFPDRATLDMGDIDFSSIETCGQFTSYPNTNDGEVFERCRDSGIIIANKVKMNRTVIESLPKLRMISVIATGYNNVDLEYAGEKGIRVCNVPGYAVHTVPQHTFTLILNLATKVCRYNADVAAGEWQNASSFTLLKYRTFELYGKTLGIIGLGSIGKSVADIASAFGMKVICFSKNSNEYKDYERVDLATLLMKSDIVTIHCPLTSETLNMIGRRELSLMKPSALLINTARGGIVNEEALAEALNNDVIAGAGTDVLSTEPPSEGNVLFSAKNCIITPHSAWSTVEARQLLVEETAENIRAFLRGERRNVVNNA